MLKIQLCIKGIHFFIVIFHNGTDFTVCGKICILSKILHNVTEPKLLNGSTFYAVIGNILYKGQFSQLTNCSLACLLLKYWLFISTYKADILHALVTIKKLEILALQG